MPRVNKVEVEITATDEASPKIDRLEHKIDGLEADEARVTIVAQTDRLEKQLTDAKRKLEGLDGDEATVQARLVGNIEQDLEHARALFDKLDGKTGTVKLRADTGELDKASSKLSGLTDLAGELPGPLGEAAGLLGGAGGIAAGAGLAAAAVVSLVDAATDAAIEAQTLANLTGASVENASRLLVVAKRAGIEYNDLADIAGQMNQVLAQQPELARQLGINLADGKDGIARMVEIVDTLSRSTMTAQEQALILSQLFGEEGVRQVAKLTTLVGTDLQKALDDVADTQVITADDVEQAQKFKEEWAETKALAQGVALELGQTLIPVLSDALGIVNEINTTLEGLPDIPGIGGLGDLIGPKGILNPTGQAARGLDFLHDKLSNFNDTGADTVNMFDGMAQAIADTVARTIEEQRRLEELNAEREAANRQMETYVGWLEQVGAEADNEARLREQTERHFDALARLNEEAEAHDRITPLQREADAARAATTEYETLFGTLSAEGERLRLIRAFESLKQRIDDGNLSLIDGQIAINDLRTDVARYAQDVLKLPPDVTTKIVSEVDFGSLDTAENDLMNWADRQRVVVPVTITPQLAAGLASGMSADQLERISQATGGGNPSVGSNPVTNVTVVQAPGQPAVVYGATSLHITRNGLEQRQP